MISVIDPATESVVAHVPADSAADLESAVAAASDAQARWHRSDPGARAAILHRIAAEIERAQEELAALESLNVGMPLRDARGAVGAAAATFRYYAAAVDRPHGVTIPVAGGFDFTVREPFGVVGLITPWNYPLTIASWKIAPALAAGNAVILKPSELTPLSAMRLAEIVAECGAPAGLLSVLNGPGPEIGRALVEHPQVRKVSFTGSTAVGREIVARSAASLTRVTLELGGKSPAIVFPDADLEAAAEGVVGGSFGNTGQDCCARSRILVHRSVRAEFLDRLEAITSRIVVGNPLDERTDLGPLVSAAQLARVRGFLADAPIAFAGSAPEGPGFWCAPTVVTEVPDDHPLAREEVFGPVVGVFTFDDDDEAVRRANATPYGLAASVWTADGGRALRVARALDVGAIAINSYTSVRVNTPFGGMKQSGLGRELGPDALETYSESKNVYWRTEQ